MKQWIAQHNQAFSSTVARLLSAKLSTLMIVVVMAATLCLPAALYTLVANLKRLNLGGETAPQISLFLALNAPKDAIQDFNKKLREDTRVASFRFIPREQAWHDLQQTAGLQEGDSGLDKNPLPDAYIIITKTNDANTLESMQESMQQWPNIDHVQLDSAWVKRLNALIDLGNKAVLILATLLGFALIVVMGNTIRLQILTQREEIDVSRLIGATDRFIRRPFLYLGALYGILGGLVAWVILAIVIRIFNLSIHDLAQLYASDFSLQLPISEVIPTFIFGAGFLGWLGAYLTVNRTLGQGQF